MIPVAVQRRMEAAQALFSSPNAGEAQAARAAYNRLAAKHGLKPAPKARKSRKKAPPHTLTPAALDQLADVMRFLFAECQFWVDEVTAEPLTFAVYNNHGALIRDDATAADVIALGLKNGFERGEIK